LAADVVTIGVYGWTSDRWLAALQEADVELLIDVRQRRGVRGSEYTWANAKRLEAALADAGIDYRHELDLAPTTELRQVQYAEDDRQHVGKRNRASLAAEYVRRYTEERLDKVDLGPIVAEMPKEASAALFCVERDPEACHRSLIAKRLERDYGLGVRHLRP
jgi:uncharacterized protein (DUF488 family)